MRAVDRLNPPPKADVDYSQFSLRRLGGHSLTRTASTTSIPPNSTNGESRSPTSRPMALSA